MIEIKAGNLNTMFQRIAKTFPMLKMKLKQSGIEDKPEDFVKKTFISAFYMTTGLVVALFLVLAKYNVLKGFVFVFIPVIFIIMFCHTIIFMFTKWTTNITC